MIYHSNQYSEKIIHSHAHEMLHTISDATYIPMNLLVGMYIAHEACLLESIGRRAYLKQCETWIDEAKETLEYFEPSDSKKCSGRVKIYRVYLAKLYEIAWTINVPPKDFLNYVISAEFEIFVNSNKESDMESYMAHLGRYREEIDEVFKPICTRIDKTRKQCFVPANELKKQGGDSLL